MTSQRSLNVSVSWCQGYKFCSLKLKAQRSSGVSGVSLLLMAAFVIMSHLPWKPSWSLIATADVLGSVLAWLLLKWENGGWWEHHHILLNVHLSVVWETAAYLTRSLQAAACCTASAVALHRCVQNSSYISFLQQVSYVEEICFIVSQTIRICIIITAVPQYLYSGHFLWSPMVV